MHEPRVSRPVFHIFGQSLAGFEDEDSFQNPNSCRSTPYGLQEQIEFTFEALKAQRISTGERKGDAFDSVILMGHSVGSYILLELHRMIRKDPSEIYSKVKAGILLFPTVTQIAQSPNGVKIGTLFRIPDFPKISSILAKILLWPLPRPALRWIVATVADMPEDAAEVTTEFLVSKRGIWQAL
jgi:Lipid-droplet associated hydrolase